MTVLHLVNCAALAFGPHYVYYKATPLSDYSTLEVSLKSAVVYLVTALLKIVLWAAVLKTSDDDDVILFEPYQEILKVLIGLVDIAGLYYALTQVTYRNVSFSHKFQAVGLGWAFTESVVKRFFPFIFGATSGLEFTWNFVLQALESNADLVLTLSLSAILSLLWLRKSKPFGVLPLLYFIAGIIAILPLVTSYAQIALGWDLLKLVAFEFGVSGVTSLVVWRLFVACQKPNSS